MQYTTDCTFPTSSYISSLLLHFLFSLHPLLFLLLLLFILFILLLFFLLLLLLLLLFLLLLFLLLLFLFSSPHPLLHLLLLLFLLLLPILLLLFLLLLLFFLLLLLLLLFIFLFLLLFLAVVDRQGFWGALTGMLRKKRRRFSNVEDGIYLDDLDQANLHSHEVNKFFPAPNPLVAV